VRSLGFHSWSKKQTLRQTEKMIRTNFYEELHSTISQVRHRFRDQRWKDRRLLWVWFLRVYLLIWLSLAESSAIYYCPFSDFFPKPIVVMRLFLLFLNFSLGMPLIILFQWQNSALLVAFAVVEPGNLRVSS
jgi:hypothetical protein